MINAGKSMAGGAKTDELDQSRSLSSTVLTLLAGALFSACGSGSPVNPDLGSTNESTTASSTASGEQQPVDATPTEVEPADPSTDDNDSSNAGDGDGADQPDGPATPAQSSDEPVTCGPIDLVARLRVLELVNEARATARYCGNEWYPATGELAWNDRLEQAALRHSVDLATHDIFSHTGSDGSSASQRADDAGYQWRRVGENIAAGRNTAEGSINAWLESPGHCQNIMQPGYTEMGLACDFNASSTYRSYWTQVLGDEF